MKNWAIKHRFILLLLTFTLLLRIPAVTDGLPAVFNPSEYFLAKIALSMGARMSPDPLLYVYPPFYSYLLLMLFTAWFLLGNMIGLYPDAASFAVRFLTGPDIFYILGRSFSLLCILLTIWITYRMVGKHRGEYQARLAAGMTAASITIMQFSASATPEMLLFLLSTISILIYLPLAEKPIPKMLLLAGLATGMAAGIKYNAGFLAVGLLIFVVVRKQLFRLPLLKRAFYTVAGMIGGFLVPNLHIAVAPAEYLGGFKALVEQMYFAPADAAAAPALILLTRVLETEMLLGLLWIVSGIYSMTRHFRRDVHLMLPLLLTVVTVMTWSKSGVDYLIPVFPVLTLSAARFIAEDLPSGDWMRRLAIIVFAPMVVMQCIWPVRWINDDTREQATDWLMTNLAQTDRLCYDHDHYDIGLYDVERFTAYGAGAMILPQEVKERVLSYRSSPRQVSFVPVMYDVRAGRADGFLDEHTRYRRKPLDRLLDERMDYLLTNDRFYGPYLHADPENYPPEIRVRIRDVRRFYRRLSEYTPAQTFLPDFWHEGPKLQLYDFKKME